MQVRDRYDAVQLPVYKMKNSCIFNSPPNSMADLVHRRRKLQINLKVYKWNSNFIW